MTIYLPHLGFIPGETRQVSIFYDNESNIKVNKTKVYLEQTIRHSSNDSNVESFETKNIFEEINHDGCEENQPSSLQMSMKLPNDLALTNTKYCNILQIFYNLRIKDKGL